MICYLRAVVSCMFACVRSVLYLLCRYSRKFCSALLCFLVFLVLMVRLVVLCSWHLRLRLFCFVMCVFVSCRCCCKLFGFCVVYILFAVDVADVEQVGLYCSGYVVAAEAAGGVVCDVAVVVGLF